MLTACVLNSHRWLHARLTEDVADCASVSWTIDPREADIVIYPLPPWPDPQAPQRLLARHASRWSRLFLFSQDDNPVLWAPGVFASVPANHPEVSSARGGFYVQHANYEPEHVAALQPREQDKPQFLWSFVGTVATCPSVRAPLLALEDERAFAIDTAAWSDRQRWQLEGSGRSERSQALASYAESLHEAKFVACPRGLGASSVRLFEAMRVGRCPVIISDDWLAPPFVDWASCAIRISEHEVRHLPALLREREGEAATLGLRARAVWEQRYSPKTMLNTLAQACEDIPPSQRRIARRLRMLGRSATTRETAAALRHSIGRVVHR